MALGFTWQRKFLLPCSSHQLSVSFLKVLNLLSVFTVLPDLGQLPTPIFLLGHFSFHCLPHVVWIFLFFPSSQELSTFADCIIYKCFISFPFIFKSPCYTLHEDVVIPSNLFLELLGREKWAQV